jgi:hypothetical protein
VSQNTLVLISKNQDDYLFTEQIAKNIGIPFQVANSKDKLHEILCSNLGCFIFWDYDTVLDQIPANAKFNQDLIQYFERHRVWHRIFALSSHSLEKVVVPGHFNAFSKYIYRNYDLEALKVYSYIINSILLQNPFETTATGIEDIQIQKTRIGNSLRKKATIEALGIILERKTIPKRISTSIIRAVDELILNGVFDAPVDVSGKRYKHHLERGGSFELSKKEEVEVELITTFSFLQVSVTDFFGSIDKEKFIPLLTKNFQTEEVNSSETGKITSGLGIYQILKSGLSLQVIIEPGKRAKFSLFVPWVVNVKQLKESFKFFCLRVK